MADNGFKINKSANFNPQATTPANPLDGDFFYDATAQSFAYYHNGSWANFDSVGTVNTALWMTGSDFTPEKVRNSVIKVVNGVAVAHLAGISASFSGKQITVYNAGSDLIVVEPEDATEPTSNNRIMTPTAGSMNLIAGEVAVFTYDIVANRWLLVSISSQAGAQVIATISNPGLVTLHQASLFPLDGVVLSDGDLNTATGVVGLDANKAATITAPTAAVPTLTLAAHTSAEALVLKAGSGSSPIAEWRSSVNTALGRITNAGDISFLAAARKIAWPSGVQVYAGTDLINLEVGSANDILTLQRSAATHMQAVLQSTNASYQSIWRVLNTSGNVIFGSVGTGHVDFYSNFTSRWRIDSTTGAFIGQGGDKPIQSVLDPVNAQDAATKAYVDQTQNPNMVINGNMQFWQRWDNGTNEVDAVFDANTALADRVFAADRWWTILSNSNIATLATDTFSVSKQTVTGEQDFDFCLRCRIKTKNNTWFSTYSLWMAQEIDRGFVQRARGKKIALTVRWRKGSAMADDGHIKIVTQTGDSRKSFNGNTSATWGFNNTQMSNGPTATPGSHPGFDGAGYTGSTTILDDTTANASIGTSFTTKTVVTTSIVPTDATGIVLLIGRKLGSATAGANEYLEYSRVRLVISDAAPADFQYAGGSEQTDMQLCQRYFEKSNDIMSGGLAPNSPTGSFTASIGTGGILPTVPYKVEKVLFWAGAGGAPSTAHRIAIWPDDGSPQGSIRNVSAATEPTVSVINDNSWGYHLERSGGGSVTTDDHCRWHWAADYEI